MFVGKARSIPYNGAPERCFIWLSSSLAYKQQTRLERLFTDKHASLLRKFVNYGQKKFYNIGPRVSSADEEGKKYTFGATTFIIATLIIMTFSISVVAAFLLPAKN
jgi:hypothetical protein